MSPQLDEQFVPWIKPMDKGEPTEEEIDRKAAERKRANARIEKESGQHLPMSAMSTMCPPSPEEQKARDLMAEEQKVMEEIAGEGFKPNWHSRYQEAVDKTVRKLNQGTGESSAAAGGADASTDATTKHNFAPPARGKAAPVHAPANELDEMD